jgi:hypothetical protein
VPVSELISERVVISLPLTLYALGAVDIDRISRQAFSPHARRNSATDLSVMGATQLGVAIPNFWFAMILVLVFAINLRWFSAGGFPGWDAGFWSGDESADLAGNRNGVTAGLDPGAGDAFVANRHARRGFHAHGPCQGPEPWSGAQAARAAQCA